eukprot:1159396-Pelagomonas_calceolata.AAC.4
MQRCIEVIAIEACADEKKEKRRQEKSALAKRLRALRKGCAGVTRHRQQKLPAEQEQGTLPLVTTKACERSGKPASALALRRLATAAYLCCHAPQARDAGITHKKFKGSSELTEPLLPARPRPLEEDLQPTHAPRLSMLQGVA